MENPEKVLDRPETTQNSAHSPLGNGGPRRPGNIWTPEAREDMFRRREAGEDWETICLVNPFIPVCLSYSFFLRKPADSAFD